MELKNVKTGMFLSWVENEHTVTALVSNVFYGKTNFEFAVAACIVPQRNADEIIKNIEDVEAENGIKVKTEVLTVVPQLKAFPFERYPHPMKTMYPVNERTFICTDEMYENAVNKLNTLRYAALDEVEALVSEFGFGNMAYKPFVFKYERKVEYNRVKDMNVRRETYLQMVDDTDVLNVRADGVANINGVFYAVNVDDYLKTGVVKY